MRLFYGKPDWALSDLKGFRSDLFYVPTLTTPKFPATDGIGACPPLPPHPKAPNEILKFKHQKKELIERAKSKFSFYSTFSKFIFGKLYKVFRGVLRSWRVLFVPFHSDIQPDQPEMLMDGSWGSLTPSEALPRTLNIHHLFKLPLTDTCSTCSLAGSFLFTCPKFRRNWRQILCHFSTKIHVVLVPTEIPTAGQFPPWNDPVQVFALGKFSHL